MAVNKGGDLSRPMSTILRDGTRKAHEAAEISSGAGWLVHGELDQDEYVRYLMMLWHIYDVLERALDKHSSHPTLNPTYNPKILARTPSLASDIASLLQCQETTWETHPVHTKLLLSRPKPFIDYTERLQILSDSDPSLLLAHAYVRYLGDLSGGQVIRRRAADAYAIDVEDGCGIKFYEFKSLEGTKPGTAGDYKKIKEWYRACMDAGVQDNDTLKVAILQEANKAFELNLNLFAILKGPTSFTKHTNRSTICLLGDHGSDVEDASNSRASQPKELPVEIFRGNGEQEERRVSLASVLSVVAAVCLAHFFLVTCGFTGEKWMEKLASLGVSVS